ncbi:MAG: hypothetical protein AAGH40_02960 [Verrucomicrobiota bacterium]
MKNISKIILLISLFITNLSATPQPLTTEDISKILGYRHWRIEAKNETKGNILSLSVVHHIRSENNKWEERIYRIQTHSLPLSVKDPESSRITEANALFVHLGQNESFYFDIGRVRGKREWPIKLDGFFYYTDVADVDGIPAIAAKFRDPNQTSQNKDEMLEIVELRFDLVRK